MTLQESLEYEPQELKFGTSGLRNPIVAMTDLECYANTLGFLRFVQDTHQFGEVYLGGDLRSSTPRIMAAVAQAIVDSGASVHHVGRIPTQAVGLASMGDGVPGIMVTGSHIPDHSNGIKFFKPDGEVMKPDEVLIVDRVRALRAKLFSEEAEASLFNAQGMLRQPPELPEVDDIARGRFIDRFALRGNADTFAGKTVVVYEHSAVGRDMLVEVFKRLGATVISEGRSEAFIPIDTENVTPANHAYFRELAEKHAGVFAIISTDGDSDRPFIIDENGVFHRGDEVGAIVTDILDGDAAAFPISTSDSVTKFLDEKGIAYSTTKIGSPYVLDAMSAYVVAGKQRVVGWEPNGGFLTENEFELDGQPLTALPTRDAFLPIYAVLRAASDRGVPVSRMFTTLPERYTSSGLIDDFPDVTSRQILQKFYDDTPENRAELEKDFTPEKGFGKIIRINSDDGVRMYLDNDEVAHIRPSSNAPQLRLYSIANSQERADEMVALCVAEPDGIFRQIEASLTQ